MFALPIWSKVEMGALAFVLSVCEVGFYIPQNDAVLGLMLQ